MGSLGIDHIKALTGRPVWSIGHVLAKIVFQAEGTKHATGGSRGKASDISEADSSFWLRRYALQN
ncbi:hypothetical protein KI387_030745, partial [Taxus chinensis]